MTVQTYPDQEIRKMSTVWMKYFEWVTSNSSAVPKYNCIMFPRIRNCHFENNKQYDNVGCLTISLRLLQLFYSFKNKKIDQPTLCHPTLNMHLQHVWMVWWYISSASIMISNIMNRCQLRCLYCLYIAGYHFIHKHNTIYSYYLQLNCHCITP